MVRSGTTNAFRDRTALRQWLLRVAEAEGRRVGSITYVLMSDNELLAYNRQYLAHDDLTDVITFHEGQDEDLEGDILISYERVKENAREYHVHHTAELHRVMVHGLLHLCGHQDKTAPQRTAMRQLEDRYLSWR
ncbi:MAG: rRNA maturation RNase YbeY [Flavobacteriales bacterium]|nr:rRNA maturation RNase YbeY [Flavobacteriales bacterium]